MDLELAKNIIKKTFNNKYSDEDFTVFITNLLNSVNRDKTFAYAGNTIPDAFKDSVIKYNRIGQYTDPNGQILDILAICIRPEKSLERARTMQRNFITHYMKIRGNKKYVLAAIYNENSPDWRFSFVKRESSFDFSNGKNILHEDLTPSMRFSFLVGLNEPTHTASERFIPLMLNMAAPDMKSIEEAFNIEKVTDEFFEEYKKLYIKLTESVEKSYQSDEGIRREFDRKEIKIEDFSKKLLGQIVFLYFIQKKGWLGVDKAEKWGKGSKNFLRKLYKKEIVSYNNFFNDLLEPLFYEALATRRIDDYYSRFDCRIPFLNGGLFEPIGGYDWGSTQILLNNEIFEEILNTFDLYNFTVSEDTPLERDVAVDPEMLGNIFEKLLEDRKTKGAYYTPRDVVHFMCKQSLITYLATEADGYAAKDDISTLVKYAESISEHEKTSSAKLEKGQESKKYRHILSDSIIKNAKHLDNLVSNIAVCDPAVGSGAFPVGMMHEIVKTRQLLNEISGKDISSYDLKRDTIHNCLHGVDIDNAAVEITRLRLWLSLVVDEEDYSMIKPLPNLDYKIMQGNSLFDIDIDLTGGVRRQTAEMTEIDGKFEIAQVGSLEGLLESDSFDKVEKLKRLYDSKSAFFDETDKSEKHRLHEEIENAWVELLNETTEGGFTKKQLRNNTDFFAWKLYFSEVYDKKTGFDIIIANPPYVRQEEIKPIKKRLQKEYKTYTGTADLFVYFFELAFRLLRSGGVACYISNNKWLRANYGEKLRDFLLKRRIELLIDFGDTPVFPGTTTYPLISLLSKSSPKETTTVLNITSREMDIEDYLASDGFNIRLDSLKSTGWTLADDRINTLLDKIRSKGTPLGKYVNGKIYRGILTGLNKAFVIDKETKDRLISEDAKSADVIKPFLAGKDIKRYEHLEDKGKYLIFTRRGIDIIEYPAIRKYLEQFRIELEPKPKDYKGNDWKGRKSGSYKWYEIQDNIAYHLEFEEIKIIYPNILQSPSFTIDNNGLYANQKCFIISKNDQYLLGLLNSSLIFFLFNHMLPKLRGDFFEPSAVFFTKFPIANPDEITKSKIESLAEEMLRLHETIKDASDTEKANIKTRADEIDSEIDNLVFALYDLNPQEIEIIKQETKNA